MFHVKHRRSDEADGIGISRGLFVWSGTEDRTCRIGNPRRGGMFHVKQYGQADPTSKREGSSLDKRDQRTEPAEVAGCKEEDVSRET